MEHKQINLLIVDDEEEFLSFIKKRLEARDFHVVAANCGEKAVEAARLQPIDIALVDLKMPGIDGEETLKILKQEHKWMEVVILTGHGSMDSAVHSTRAGAYNYLQKPCNIDTLIDTLTEAYKKRVMNKKSIEAERMEKILSSARAFSPRELLMKLREMDSKES